MRARCSSTPHAPVHGALQRLRLKLSKPFVCGRWAGRNMDKKESRVKVKVDAEAVGPVDDKWKFDFELNRFDEFGRKLTPKEAFRELCWRFHGASPRRQHVRRVNIRPAYS